MRQLYLALILIFPFILISQNVILRGNVKDTASHQGLPNAVLMALRFSDSSLVAFSRTDTKGLFKAIKVPLDTYIVVISHPSFSDKIYLFEATPKDTMIRFSNVILPPKSIALNEIEVLAYRDKMYYKGDTMVFTADSFKTRPNATVEDLLKKLPGFRVDAQGKITVQGKEVDQVLVDGDEFFGTDPTIATRNLNATSIANVQVYDKKNENNDEGNKETVKVLNLQMKEDAKKGYFGKISGASDFQKFYEGELLANRFKGNQKVSVFALAANTPKQAFGNGDAWKFGLTEERDYSYDEETNSWTSKGGAKTGIPQTLKSGFYFNDKFGKNLKINADYTFNQNQLEQSSETNTQNFLADTAFSTQSLASSKYRSQSHSFNMNVKQKLDSLTELFIIPKIKYSKADNSSAQTDDFFTEEGLSTRQTSIQNSTSSENTESSIQIRVVRNFKKKDRLLTVGYTPSMTQNTSTTKLNTNFHYFRSNQSDSNLVQQRELQNEKTNHNITASYTEPITKKIKLNFNYQFGENILSNTRNTFDFAGAAYDLYNPNLSNSFQNTRMTNKAGLKFIYDVKKYRISFGSFFRNVQQENFNRSTNVRLNQQQNIALPAAAFQYRFGQNSNLDLSYDMQSNLPDLLQMQPVVDNSNPNRLSIGTPSLVPNLDHNINFNYYFFKNITDVNFWSGANFGTTRNDFSSATRYDSIGRAIVQTINVNGNTNFNMYLGGGFPVFKRFFKIYYSLNATTNNQVNYVNEQYNKTTTTGLNPSLTFEKSVEKYNVRVQGNYSYNIPKSTISNLSNQPYYTYGVEGDILVRLPKKFFVSTDGVYTNNGNRAVGYNLNYFIWNASLGKSFLKTENLVVSLNAYDLLNQNINNQRSITSNQIVDNKTQIIKRYFLLKVLLKFNNQKTKVEDND